MLLYLLARFVVLSTRVHALSPRWNRIPVGFRARNTLTGKKHLRYYAVEGKILFEPFFIFWLRASF